MTAARQRNARLAAGGFGETTTGTDDDSAAVASAQGASLLTRSLWSYNVVIIGGDKRGLWRRYANRESAERMASKLRRNGFDARIEVAS